MSKAIGVEELGLFGMVVVAGLVGFIVRSCNNTSVADHDITEKQHEFDVKNPSPCVSYSYLINNKIEDCKPGYAPSYKNLGNDGIGRRDWLFCTCPEQKQEKPEQKQEKVDVKAELKEEPLPFGKLDDDRLIKAIEKDKPTMNKD